MKRNSRRPQQQPPPPSSSLNLQNSQQTLVNDQSSKQAAIRAINSYLSHNNFPVNLSRKPLPSAKYLTAILKFLLSRLDYVRDSSINLEDEVLVVLKSLNCPIQVNKSAFRDPGAPHCFPLILSVIHWLVQLADFRDHLRRDEKAYRNRFRKNPIMAYIVDSYLAFMKGDDEFVEVLDMKLTETMEKEARLRMENMNAMDEEGKKLEAELNALKTMPLERETVESQRKDLEADLDKFRGFVASLQDAISVIREHWMIRRRN